MSYLKQLNEKYPVRITKKQKDEFLTYALSLAEEKNVKAQIEQNGKHKNLVVGNPNTANVVFTAHYDTPNASLLPNLMLPKNKGLFYAYQFLIIGLLLVVSLVPAIVVGLYVLQSELAYAGIFLVLYFGLFFLGFKFFKNKNNANDNTSGIATVFSILEKLDSKQLDNVAFILFDNEEKGLLGSKTYQKAHREEMKDKLLINLDCVANGDNILFIAKPKAEENEQYNLIKRAFASGNDKFNVEFYSTKECVANSDHKKFEQGVCVVACKKSKKGVLYAPYIHTAKDVVADDKNIEFISGRFADCFKKSA